jgi:3-oxoadipate enol-lactonase
MPFVQLTPDLNLHYLDVNPDGTPALVLLHALGASSASWELQIPALVEAGLRVIAPDLRGFGQTKFTGREVTIARMAGDVDALMKALGLEQAHVLGLSMGGTVALQFALDYPQRVDRLVLVNTFSRLRPANPGEWAYFAARFLVLHFLGLPQQGRLVARRVFPRPEQAVFRQELLREILQADPRCYRAAVRSLARFNLDNRLGEIKRPVLVVTGEDDNTISPHVQGRLAAAIPTARQVVIPNAGHAVIVDQASTFNRTLLEFLCPGLGVD